MSLSLTVLGSADAFNSAGRANACYLVQDRDGAFCVDFGPTALMALRKLGFSPNDLDAVLLTHLHGDHFGGLAQLLLDAHYCSGRRRALAIGGPKGTAERIEAWCKLAYGAEAARRRFTVRYLEWAPGRTARAAGRRLSTFRANHMDEASGALMLRIEAGGRVLAFTGDTGWTDELPELARGADLLVCECTEDQKRLDTHLSWEVLAPRLGRLRARRILLTHLSQAMRRKAAKLKVPRVQLADDGLVVRLG